MDAQTTLQRIGFSKAESLVYLALLRLGKTKSGAVIKQTGLQSSVVHNALNTLTEKGFVSHVLVGKIKHYSPLEPQALLNYMDAKRQEVVTILPSLQVLQERKISLLQAEVFEGYSGIFTAFMQFAMHAKRGDMIKYFAVRDEFLSDEALELFRRVDSIHKRKGLITKGIASSDKNSEVRSYSDSEIRFVDQDIPPSMNVCNDMILLTTFQERPVGVLIRSTELAQQYHDLWDSLWKVAKKTPTRTKTLS